MGGVGHIPHFPRVLHQGICFKYKMGELDLMAAELFRSSGWRIC